MFSIEHEFDATIITLVDEGDAALREDIVVAAKEDRIVLTQWQSDGDGKGKPVQITMSLIQLADLAAALDLPEGVYRRVGDD
ncbi:MAG TPA: hypothetical protein ENK28_05355 [Aliiroseovarius sp.]|nr:hypothetical protein [Aliiroseovarius sp.]